MARPKAKMDAVLSVFMMALIFFIPVSSSLKTVFTVLILTTVLSFKNYRQAFISLLKSPWIWPSLALFIFILIACSWTPASFSQQLTAINKYSKLLLFPIFIVGFMNARTRHWSMWAFILAMLLTGTIALLQKYHFVNLHGDGFIDPGHVFHSHIMTGFLMAFASYYCAAMFFKLEKKQVRWVYLMLALFFSYQVLFVNIGRSAYIIYFVLMLLLCVQCFSMKQAIIGVLASISLFALIYMASPVMRGSVEKLIHDYQNYQQNKLNTSLGFRIQFHQYAKALFLASPLRGHGTASFTFFYDRDNPVPNWWKKLLEPHSEYLLIAAQQGVIGLTLLFLFFGSLLWNARKLVETKIILSGLVIAFAIGCLSDSLLFYGGPGYFLIALGALCYGEFFESLKKQVSEVANTCYKAPAHPHPHHVENNPV